MVHNCRLKLLSASCGHFPLLFLILGFPRPTPKTPKKILNQSFSLQMQCYSLPYEITPIRQGTHYPIMFSWQLCTNWLLPFFNPDSKTFIRRMVRNPLFRKCTASFSGSLHCYFLVSISSIILSALPIWCDYKHNRKVIRVTVNRGAPPLFYRSSQSNNASCLT